MTYADDQDELLIQMLNLEERRDKEDRDRCERLEHLDEGYTQSSVSAVCSKSYELSASK